MPHVQDITEACGLWLACQGQHSALTGRWPSRCAPGFVSCAGPKPEITPQDFVKHSLLVITSKTFQGCPCTATTCCSFEPVACSGQKHIQGRRPTMLNTCALPVQFRSLVILTSSASCIGGDSVSYPHQQLLCCLQNCKARAGCR